MLLLIYVFSVKKLLKTYLKKRKQKITESVRFVGAYVSKYAPIIEKTLWEKRRYENYSKYSLLTKSSV